MTHSSNSVNATQAKDTDWVMNIINWPAGFNCFYFYLKENPEAFQETLQLRKQVFIEEQQVPEELENDALDEAALHWAVIDSNTSKTIATGRTYAYQEACQARPIAQIGRVAVDPSYRKKLLGLTLMQAILAYLKTQDYTQVTLHAQTQAIPFYEKLGFVKEGFEFEEAGIPHYQMRLIF